MNVRDLFPRLAVGAYVLNSGFSKRGADPDTAEGLHGMASGAYPPVEKMEAGQFTRMLSNGEIALGALLLTPFVPSALAGGALAGFAASLVGLYLRTPGMHEEGSVRPTPQGIPLAKDVWMLGIGLGMVAQAVAKER